MPATRQDAVRRAAAATREEHRARVETAAKAQIDGQKIRLLMGASALAAAGALAAMMPRGDAAWWAAAGFLALIGLGYVVRGLWVWAITARLTARWRQSFAPRPGAE